MGRKLDDLKLLVKNDKRIQFGAAFIALALVTWGLTRDGPHSRIRRPDETASKPGQGAQEAYGDLMTAVQNDLKQEMDEQREMKAVVTRINSNAEATKQRFTGIVENFLDRLEQLNRQVELIQSASSKPPDGPMLVTRVEPAPEDTIERFGGDFLPPAPEPPLPPKRRRVSVITPGASVDVTLQTGVHAPVDGSPYPVVFQLNGPIRGPNGLTIELGEAQLVGVAVGSAGDGRAIFRLSSLSFAQPNGQVSTVKVDGWIIGEDGVEGMKGRLVDKLGRLIVATAAVSGAAALGDRLGGNGRANYRVGQPGLGLSASDVDEAAVTALGHASDRLGKVLIDRYESYVPVVEVLSNREAVAVFSQGAEVRVLEDDGEGSGGPSGEEFAGGFGD